MQPWITLFYGFALPANTESEEKKLLNLFIFISIPLVHECEQSTHEIYDFVSYFFFRFVAISNGLLEELISNYSPWLMTYASIK